MSAAARTSQRPSLACAPCPETWLSTWSDLTRSGTNSWTTSTFHTNSRFPRIAFATRSRNTRVKDGSLKAVTAARTCWKGHYFRTVGSANLHTKTRASPTNISKANSIPTSSSSSTSTTCTAWSSTMATGRLAATISAFARCRPTRREMKHTGSNLTTIKSLLSPKTRSTAGLRRLTCSSTAGAGTTRKSKSQNCSRPRLASNSPKSSPSLWSEPNQSSLEIKRWAISTKVFIARQKWLKLSSKSPTPKPQRDNEPPPRTRKSSLTWQTITISLTSPMRA